MTNYPLELYTSSDWPRVATLLGGWAFKPLAGHDRWPAEKLLSLCLARADSALESIQTNAWIVRMGNSVLGLTSLTQLLWDSRLLGMAAARIDYLVASGSYREQYQIKQNLISSALMHGAKRDIQHFSARLDASDLSGLHVLEQAGFITVDSILTFALNLNSAPVSEPAVEGINIRMATGADSEATAELARKAYVYDRFHADPAVPTDKADELHAEWLRNSCAGRAVDAVIVAEDDKGVVGFVTCKLQLDTESHLGKLIGTIVLVATARRARGKGIARAMTLAAIEWFRAQSVEIVEVGTQLRNVPASRVYQNCGFRLVGSSISLRKLF